MSRELRQEAAVQWATLAFGPDHVNSLPQRAVRFLEEAVELYQAAGGNLEMAHQLLDFMFARPVGEIEQELGGAGLTLLLVANAAGMSADAAEAKEFRRVLSKPASEFGKRNEEKNAAGFDAGAYPTRDRFERATTPARCPRCNSPDPARHPSMQFEGEVQLCTHPWHGAVR